MLSEFLTTAFYKDNHDVVAYGLDTPKGYPFTRYIKVNLLNDNLDYDELIKSDIIVYAAGAGVQAALKTDSSLMYKLNLSVPIEITLQLKKHGYRGIYISFGSYMEIGINNDETVEFTESDIVLSNLPVSNDYALSKRLYGRYMYDLNADYLFWHFILPNMFSYNDTKPGTRLIPYTLQYLQSVKRGECPPEPSFSAGLQTREFILMEDIFNVLNKSYEKKIPAGVYNIGGGEFMSIRDLIERIFKIYDVKCKDSYFGKEQRRDGDIKSLCLCADKLKSAIGYLPSTKIDDVIKETM